jgi:hypothetical protein
LLARDTISGRNKLYVGIPLVVSFAITCDLSSHIRILATTIRFLITLLGNHFCLPFKDDLPEAVNKICYRK